MRGPSPIKITPGGGGPSSAGMRYANVRFRTDGPSAPYWVATTRWTCLWDHRRSEASARRGLRLLAGFSKVLEIIDHFGPHLGDRVFPLREQGVGIGSAPAIQHESGQVGPCREPDATSGPRQIH